MSSVVFLIPKQLKSHTPYTSVQAMNQIRLYVQAMNQIRFFNHGISSYLIHYITYRKGDDERYLRFHTTSARKPKIRLEQHCLVLTPAQVLELCDVNRKDARLIEVHNIYIIFQCIRFFKDPQFSKYGSILFIYEIIKKYLPSKSVISFKGI